jgi:hypothetical protein
LIDIPFAAAAAGFVTFAKSNAKALLTAEPSKEHCALRGGYAASAEAYAVFLGLCVVPTSSKYGVTVSLSTTEFASMPPPTGREKFENSLCHPSPNLRIFRWGRDMRWGLCQPMLCLVCHSQERATLLS